MNSFYVNIGLNVGGEYAGQEQEKRAVELLSELGPVQYAVKVSSYVFDGTTVEETTVVAYVQTRYDVSEVAEWAYSVSVALKQDCVAVSFDNGITGELYGPKSEDYGRFSPEYFIRWAA